MSNSSTRPLLSGQRSPRYSLGDPESTVSKLQGLFCSISQTAQSLGNKLKIPSPRLSLGNRTELLLSERVCLKELLQQEEHEEAMSSRSSSPVSFQIDVPCKGNTLHGHSSKEAQDKAPLISGHEMQDFTSSPQHRTLPTLKIDSARRSLASPMSLKSLDLTQPTSTLFDDSTFDYLGDINANVTDSILSSPTSEMVLYKETPLTKVVRPMSLFSTPSPNSKKEDDSWIEPWYLLTDNYRTDVTQALVRPLSYYLSTIPLDMTTSSFESGNGSVIDLSWDEYDMAAVNSPSGEVSSSAAVNRRSLIPARMDEETPGTRRKRISLAACLRSPLLSPLLQSPNSPLNQSGSLRKLSKRSRRNLGTPLTLASGSRSRRNYENETDEELVKILCDRDREIEKLKSYRDELLRWVVHVMSGSRCS